MESTPSPLRTDIWHWTLDARDVPAHILSDMGVIDRALRECARICDMQILAGPFLVRGAANNPGITAACIVDCSHISLHTFDVPQELSMDIFSSRPYDPEKIKEYLFSAFSIDPEKAIFCEVKWPHEYHQSKESDAAVHMPKKYKDIVDDEHAAVVAARKNKNSPHAI